MSISIANTSALIAITALSRNTASMQKSLERLSTGYRINSAADDPSGLIASESLQAEEASTSAAISNAQRADNVLATADGAMSEVSNLLISLQGLLVNSANQAGLSKDEVSANQLQVDSILSTINRISNSTSFDGNKLLNGNYSYRTSGANPQVLQGLAIHTAQVSPSGETLQVQVLASAQHAALIFHGTAGGLTAPVTLSLEGNEGPTEISFASSTSVTQIASAVNQLSNAIGIVASASGNDVTFLSTGYGSAQFVSVQSNSAALQTQTLTGETSPRTFGRDLEVSINGEPTVGNGLSINAVANGFSGSFSLNAQQNTTGNIATFSITGGGANFAISPQLDAAGLLSLAIDPVNTAALGVIPNGTASYSLSDLGSGGSLSLGSNHLDIAQQVVSGAIEQVSTSRALIGATRAYDIQSTINSLNVKLENLAKRGQQHSGYGLRGGDCESDAAADIDTVVHFRASCGGTESADDSEVAAILNYFPHSGPFYWVHPAFPGKAMFVV